MISGVRPEDMHKAQSFEELQMKVKNLISKKIVVGHGLGSDFKALKLKHPRKDIRDTAIYFQNKLGGKPSLAKLAQERLGIKIQSGEHSSIQDARAALRIYLGGALSTYFYRKMTRPAPVDSPFSTVLMIDFSEN